MTEEFVKNSVIKYLSRKEWGTNLHFGSLRDRGVDIKVRHNRYSRYFLIECKGDPNPDTFGSVNSGREVAFNYVLGQIVSRMRSKSKYWYAIGLPDSMREKIIKRLPKEVCKKLRLKILLVSENGKVEELNWRHLK